MDDDHGNNENPRVKRRRLGPVCPRHASFPPSSTSLAALQVAENWVDLRLPERVRVLELVVPARRSILFSRPRDGFFGGGKKRIVTSLAAVTAACAHGRVELFLSILVILNLLFPNSHIAHYSCGGSPTRFYDPIVSWCDCLCPRRDCRWRRRRLEQLCGQCGCVKRTELVEIVETGMAST